MQATSNGETADARRIMVWKDFVPEFLRFPLMLLIIVIFMLSGGVYMSAAAEISGSHAWIKEDVLMAGYASMTGLTVAFPLLFRILYRFRTRSILLVSAAAFVICDYVCMTSRYLPLVVLMSFISGFFRILSTFTCWNTLQLRITPKRDFAVFFPFLFTFILGSVQLTDIVTGYCISAFEWRAMHRLTIGAFTLVFALVFFCMRRSYRQAPYVPFWGIDYIGGILWSAWLICIVFIFVYGEHYDWLDSGEIRTAAVFAIVLLALCLERASSIRHPYISMKTFSQRNMIPIFILFGCMSMMSTMVSSVQNIYTNAVLGFDARHNADLCWGVVAGIAAGALFFHTAFRRLGWRIKNIVLSGFIAFFLYQVMLYFLVDASTEKYMLYLPMAFKGAGVSIVYTALTYALAGSVSFACYFEAMCVIGFIRTSFGGPLNSAIITNLFHHISQETRNDLGSSLDMMSPVAGTFSETYAEFQRQMTMASIKEIYGYAAIAAILVITAILASDYRQPARTGIIRMLRPSQLWRNVRQAAYRALKARGE